MKTYLHFFKGPCRSALRMAMLEAFRSTEVRQECGWQLFFSRFPDSLCSRHHEANLCTSRSWCRQLTILLGVIRRHFGSRAISVQVNIVAVSAHVFHRFPFDLLIQMSATQLSLFLCIPFVLMSTDRTFEDTVTALHTKRG